jgi:hypothetical protein
MDIYYTTKSCILFSLNFPNHKFNIIYSLNIKAAINICHTTNQVFVGWVEALRNPTSISR